MIIGYVIQRIKDKKEEKQIRKELMIDIIEENPYVLMTIKVLKEKKKKDGNY